MEWLAFHFGFGQFFLIFQCCDYTNAFVINAFLFIQQLLFQYFSVFFTQTLSSREIVYSQPPSV